MVDRQWFVLYVLICLEVGVLLILVPWSAIWERNYFLQAYPMIRPVVLDPTFRGAVSGLGVANLYVVLRDVMRRRQTDRRTLELFPGGVRFERRADGEPSPSQKAATAGEKTTTHQPRALLAPEKSSQNV